LKHAGWLAQEDLVELIKSFPLPALLPLVSLGEDVVEEELLATRSSPVGLVTTMEQQSRLTPVQAQITFVH